MFSEDQSDVQEFFLYLVDEISKEVDSLSSDPQSNIKNAEQITSMGTGDDFLCPFWLFL